MPERINPAPPPDPRSKVTSHRVRRATRVTGETYYLADPPLPPAKTAPQAVVPLPPQTYAAPGAIEPYAAVPYAGGGCYSSGGGTYSAMSTYAARPSYAFMPSTPMFSFGGFEEAYSYGNGGFGNGYGYGGYGGGGGLLNINAYTSRPGLLGRLLGRSSAPNVRSFNMSIGGGAASLFGGGRYGSMSSYGYGGGYPGGSICGPSGCFPSFGGF
jgi:hypothetical protein